MPEERLKNSMDVVGSDKTMTRPLAGRVIDELPRLLSEHGTLIAVMSLGIVVRAVGPHLSDKTTDGAILVVDETARNVISVAGGHIGGANALAEELAAGLGATPVITTSSDAQGLPAFDLVAAELGLVPRDQGSLKRIAAAITNGEDLRCYCDDQNYRGQLTEALHGSATFHPLEDLPADEDSCGVCRMVVSDRSDIQLSADVHLFRPRSLVAGVGCKAGVSPDAVSAAITNTLQAAGLHPDALKGIATAELKSDEAGIVDAARQLERPLFIVSHDEIISLEPHITASEAVRSRIGLPAVSEPAALAAAGGELIVRKQIHGGVTVAIARVASPSEEPKGGAA